MTLYEETAKIFTERHAGENIYSRQIRALADATENRLKKLEDQLTTRIIRASSSDRNV